MARDAGTSDVESARGARDEIVRRVAASRLARTPGIGLRAQIMVTLGVGFALSVGLLGMATSKLGERAIDRDRRHTAAGVAEALAIASAPPALPRRELFDAVVGRGGVIGVELLGPASFLVGTRGVRAPIRAVRGVTEVRVWLGSPAFARRSLPGLLFLYVGITAAAILLLSYVLLTRAIVRPVESLTRASERLARGSESSPSDIRVPVEGAAEIARLAITFNEMNELLADERSALKQRIAEIEHATAELHAAQGSLIRSEKMASVGRLAAGVAHEIGNPLTSILGLLELVDGGGLRAEDQHEFLRRARKETERIGTIIRDLLDFARGEPAADETGATADLVEVVEDAVRLIGPQKDLRQVTLERRFAPGLSRVVGPAARLSQVVLNLLLNAADAIAGEGTIRIEVHPIENGGRIELVITDTGPGIPDHARDKIFEPFFTTKPPGEGTGLGLAVCHSIIEQLGGHIEVDNSPDGGARFTIRLRAEPSQDT